MRKQNLFFIGVMVFSFCLFGLAGKAEAAVLSRAPNNLSLAGYWHFNDGRGLVAGDSSGQGNSGTLTQMDAATDWVSGKFGTGLDFDNSNDRVIVANETNFDFTSGQSITISAWVKPNSLTNAQDEFIVAKGDPLVSRQYSMRLRSSSTGTGRLQFVYYDNVASAHIYQHDTSSSVTNGVWNHVAVTYTFGTGSTAKMYINGVLVSASWSTGSGNVAPGDTATQLSIGSEYTTDADEMFGGVIDEVRVFRRLFTAADALALYRAGSARLGASSADLDAGTSLENGLVGHWTMDGQDYNAASTTAEVLDRSGQGNNGDAQNGPTRVSGKLGQGLKFDGGDDYVNIPSNAVFDTANGTWSFWTYIRELPAGNGDVMISRHDASGGINGLGIGVAPTLAAFVNNGSGNVCFADAGAVSTGQWYHVVFAFSQANGATSRLYLNGSQVATCTNSASWSFNAQAVRLTDSLYAFWEIFDGNIDEVRVYNRVLTTAEVKQLYTLGAGKLNTSQNQTGGTLDNGLSGLWSFNGPDMNWGLGLAYDRSGSGNNGSILNMSTSTSPVGGKVGQALKFDGDDDGVTTNFNAGTYPITGCAWFKYENSTAFQSTIFSDQEFDVTVINDVGNQDFINVYNANGTLNSGSDSIRAGIWTHVCVSVTAGNIASTYINGALAAGPSSIGGPVPCCTLVIGDWYGGGGTITGVVDEVRMYNRNLTASEIKQLYDMGR